MKKTRILISGWYGKKNIGDEAILLAMLKSIKKYVKSSTITVLSLDPSYTSSHYNVNSAPQFPLSLKKLILFIIKFDFLRTFISLLRSNIFILGGGGFLSDWQSWTVITTWLFQIVIAKILGKKTMLYAVGVGPINTKIGQFFTRLILNNFTNKITVRDYTSKKFLLKCNVTKPIYVTADPAVNLTTSNKSIQKIENRPKIGIAISPIFHLNKFWPNQSQKYRNFKNIWPPVIDKLVDLYNADIYLIIMHPSSDLELAKNIHKKVRQKNKVFISNEKSINQCIMTFNKMTFVIAMRFHSIIFSAINYVPILGICYHYKSYAFLKRISQQSYSINIGDGIHWKNSELNKFDIIRISKEILSNKNSISKVIEKNAKKLQKIEHNNIKHLLSLIK